MNINKQKIKSKFETLALEGKKEWHLLIFFPYWNKPTWSKKKKRNAPVQSYGSHSAVTNPVFY